MRPKAALLARVKVGKRYLFEAVEIKNGKPVEPDEPTSYYLKYSQNGKQRVEAVGSDLSRAFVAFQNRELNQARTRMGLSAITELGPARDASGRMKIAHAVAVYLQDLADATKTGERSKGTERGYKNAVEDFRDHCGVEFLDEITAEVLKRYKLHMFENIKKRVHGTKHNTVAKRFRFLNTFFNKFGIKMVRDRAPQKGDTGLMNYLDVPREQKKPNTDKYSAEEIKAMLAVADVNEADLIHVFLRSGMRDEEVAFLEWKDIDWKRQQVMVREKPGIWKPKDKENRNIPVEDGVLLKRLEERRERQKPKSHLIFPNTLGRPDMHLIRQLHKVVGKVNENGGEIDGVPTLHRFRRTYASVMISHSDLQTVSALLGHSDISTTSLYLAKDESKARVGTRTAFKDWD
ncbi:MAG: tyrosine-type recombinase/integrase [Candidatus Acidiferrales bacterium]